MSFLQTDRQTDRTSGQRTQAALDAVTTLQNKLVLVSVAQWIQADGPKTEETHLNSLVQSQTNESGD